MNSRRVNLFDLQQLFEQAPYTQRENELTKLTILKSNGYSYRNSNFDSKDQLIADGIDKQIDSMKSIHIIKKEELRWQLLEEKSIRASNYTKKIFKQIN